MENTTTFDIDPELMSCFVDEAKEGLSEMDALFVKLESDPENIEIINSIFRPIHTIKGNSAFFGLMKVKTLAHEMETLLSLAKNGKLYLDSDVVSVLLAGIDQLKDMLERARKNEPEISDQEKFNALINSVISAKQPQNAVNELWNDLFQKLQTVKCEIAKLQLPIAGILETAIETAKNINQNKTVNKTDSAEPAKKEPRSDVKAKVNNTPESSKQSEIAKTMRVSEKSIDNFLSYVGELIVVGEMYNYLQKNITTEEISDLAKDFRRVNQTFKNLSSNLQSSIMEIRKVPMKSILQKSPRIVRDIASSTEKDIEVEIIGQQVEVDKRIVEMLDAPLTHMVRNAADHGIEPKQERMKIGKNQRGKIKIEIIEESEYVSLKISDDGRGLNLDKIKEKAVKNGVIKQDQPLTNEQLVDLIFAPGVSTAEKVTDVSGRGVGMDVVRQNINQANGKITINTKSGQGSEFIITMPKAVTTQIIEGFLVEVDKSCYVIPMEKVREVFKPQEQDISSVRENSLCVMRHNQLMPIVDLSKTFAVISDDTNIRQKIMVSVDINNKKTAIAIDDVLGVQKVVLKDLAESDVNSQLFSAAAIMGNGSLAMVIELDSIIQQS